MDADRTCIGSDWGCFAGPAVLLSKKEEPLLSGWIAFFPVRASRVCSCTFCHAGVSGDSGRNMFNSAGIARD